MRPHMFVTLLAGALAPLAAPAQEPEAQLAQVQVLHVAPPDVASFESSVARLAQAAAQARLGEGYHWTMWQNVLDYTVVMPVQSMAYFDDPEQFWRGFEGTEVEDSVQATLANMAPLDVKIVSNEVVASVPDWSYIPETASQEPGLALVHDVWVAPGSAQEFARVIQQIKSFLEEIEYPYAIYANSIRLGDSGRYQFVVAYDARAAFFGENDLERMAAAKGARETWNELTGRLLSVSADWRQSHWRYRPDLSHPWRM